MAKSPDSTDLFAQFCNSFAGLGLDLLGGLELEPSLCPAEHKGFAGHSALLIGSHGQELWEHFSGSSEFSDEFENPLDRWTIRVLGDLTVELGCEVFHPSLKPYWPFQRIAESVTKAQQSPLGIFIHPEFGLWHGLRGLLVFSPNHEFSNHVKSMSAPVQEPIHPCDVCEGKPCLTACPAAAFKNDTLDVASCFSHLDSNNSPDCMSLGCQARDACPVGQEFRYTTEQIQFHMKSYRGV
ncbi:MAG: ferredoxin [Pseudomonadota bacterium]